MYPASCNFKARGGTVTFEGEDITSEPPHISTARPDLPPGLAAVVGKTAFHQYVHDSMQIPGFKITWTSSDVIFSPDQNLAYMFSDNAVTMEAPDGEPATTPGPGHHYLASRSRW